MTTSVGRGDAERFLGSSGWDSDCANPHSPISRQFRLVVGGAKRTGQGPPRRRQGNSDAPHMHRLTTTDPATTALALRFALAAACSSLLASGLTCPRLLGLPWVLLGASFSCRLSSSWWYRVQCSVLARRKRSPSKLKAGETTGPPGICGRGRNAARQSVFCCQKPFHRTLCHVMSN